MYAPIHAPIQSCYSIVYYTIIYYNNIINSILEYDVCHIIHTNIICVTFSCSPERGRRAESRRAAHKSGGSAKRKGDSRRIYIYIYICTDSYGSIYVCLSLSLSLSLCIHIYIYIDIAAAARRRRRQRGGGVESLNLCVANLICTYIVYIMCMYYTPTCININIQAPVEIMNRGGKMVQQSRRCGNQLSAIYLFYHVIEI